MSRTIELKALHVQIPKKTIVYLKTVAAKKDTSMARIVMDCIELYKKSNNIVLTEDTTNV